MVCTNPVQITYRHDRPYYSSNRKPVSILSNSYPYFSLLSISRHPHIHNHSDEPRQVNRALLLLAYLLSQDQSASLPVLSGTILFKKPVDLHDGSRQGVSVHRGITVQELDDIVGMVVGIIVEDIVTGQEEGAMKKGMAANLGGR